MNRWVLVFLLLFATIINFADKNGTSVASIHIIKDFNLSYVQYGLLGSIFFWFFAISGIIGGAWSDTLGTKKMLGILLLAWTILQFSTYFIMSFPLLLMYRLLLGIFEGPFGPVAISHLSRSFPPASRAMAISICNAGGIIGALVMSPVLVHLNQSFGWRITFVLLGGASLLLFLVWTASKDSSKSHIDATDTAPRKFKWSEFKPILFSPTSAVTLFALFSSFWMVVWIMVWLPAYLVEAVHLSEAKMGFAVLIIGLINMIVTVSASTWSDRMYKKTKNLRTSRVLFTALLQIISALLLVIVTFTQNHLLVVTLIGVAMGLSTTLLNVGPVIMMSLLPERRGLMVSLGTSFQNISGIVGPIICGYLIQSAGNKLIGFNYTILCTAFILIVGGALFSLFAKPDHPISKSTKNLGLTDIKEMKQS
ncbi:putative MFS family arabinose efflux permease [Cytobacillus firmus]|uniref:Putative MFS family arabinose efflux permease n=2 Tax=Cytobacillus TaxID=2675230 RepID=A0A366K3Y9_CYTFI|nr:MULTISPECIES: MFS transporter [Cytobacillus]RBP95843.1 putative MFS family arabinose efflux permease [Cytobacillus firmus]TDX44756.1 putative MFS family arabinose efflux permease [Cytobacillus oceanisediminis]